MCVYVCVWVLACMYVYVFTLHLSEFTPHLHEVILLLCELALHLCEFVLSLCEFALHLYEFTLLAYFYICVSTTTISHSIYRSLHLKQFSLNNFQRCELNKFTVPITIKSNCFVSRAFRFWCNTRSLIIAVQLTTASGALLFLCILLTSLISSAERIGRKRALPLWVKKVGYFLYRCYNSNCLIY